MKKSTPTIRDVAAAAGVSTATVSKFVNGAQRFSPAVEAAITRVVADLGYRSNPLAQSMITGRTRSIGLSVLDVANPHFTSVVKGTNRVTHEGGRLCSTIMLGAEPPDALICYNDLMALGFMKSARVLGFRLPADISVAGFDDIQFVNHTSPPLTTVDLQSGRLGAAAMERLIAAVEGEPVEAYNIIEPQLILRGSTANRNG